MKLIIESARLKKINALNDYGLYVPRQNDYVCFEGIDIKVINIIWDYSNASMLVMCE